MPDYDRLIDAETWAFIRRTGEFYPDDAVDLTIAGQRDFYRDKASEAFRRIVESYLETGEPVDGIPQIRRAALEGGPK